MSSSNPLCSICNEFPTNHVCGFHFGERVCGKPVCSVCKAAFGSDDDLYRCAEHNSSTAVSNVGTTIDAALENHPADVPVVGDIVGGSVLRARANAFYNSPSVIEGTIAMQPEAGPINSSVGKKKGTRGTITVAGTSKARVGVPTPSTKRSVPGKRAAVGSRNRTSRSAGSDPTEPSPAAASSAKTSNSGRRSTRSTSKGGILAPTNTDVFIGKSVAFLCAGDLGDKLAELFRGQIPVEAKTFVLHSDGHLLGTVLRKHSGHPNSYDIEWEYTDLGVSYMSQAYLLDAVQTAESIAKAEATHARTQSISFGLDPFDRNPILRDILLAPSPDDIGEPDESESDDDIIEGDDCVEMTYNNERVLNNYAQMYMDSIQDSIMSPEEVEQIAGLTWRRNGKLSRAPGVIEREATFVPGKEAYFTSPLSSFLAFIPMMFWDKLVYESNTYAEQRMREQGQRIISGAAWKAPISLNEMMCFFGLLIKFTCFQIHGRSYEAAWRFSAFHPYVSNMSLSRFRQIRSVLHLSDNEKAHTHVDKLRKVRPLLSVLKNTLGAYIDVGTEVALDEATVASKSSYGKEFICYNPMKNTGKYHFKFYMLCCSQTFACIRLRMHTKTSSDVADAQAREGDDVIFDHNQDDEPEQNEQQLSKLNALILDMCKPLENKGNVVNMDNYYTNPTVAAQLKLKGILCRGTVRSNRRMFPKCILFSPQEARTMPRGSLRMAVNHQFGITAYGWLDGNPVQMLSTADGTDVGAVMRQVNDRRIAVAAPRAIGKYNQNMQSVDRHDQLRVKFALATRHQFKKYYVKIILALVDIAATNAVIHYFKANPDKKEEKESRANFMDELSDRLIDKSTPWTQLNGSDNIGKGDATESLNEQGSIDILQEMGIKVPLASIIPSTEQSVRNRCTCTPTPIENLVPYKKKWSSVCQICNYEERKMKWKTVLVCPVHSVRLCFGTYPDRSKGGIPIMRKDGNGESVSDYSWLCQDHDLTCWEKFHSFYQPNNLFTTPANAANCDAFRFAKVRLSSELYKRKCQAFGMPSTRRGKKRKKNRTTESAERDKIDKESDNDGSETDSEE
jgi:Transposase IS4